jgi:predicted nucleic acid-binding protein
MNAEFVDTNILVYAHDSGAGSKHAASVELLDRLFRDGTGVVSTQVLAEFYSIATRKLGMGSQEAEDVLVDLGNWPIHRPGHADLVRAAGLQRRYKIGWWDALILTSAIEMGSQVLWSEDLAKGQRYANLVVRNPFQA